MVKKKAKAPEPSDHLIISWSFDLGPQQNCPLKMGEEPLDFDYQQKDPTIHLELSNAGNLSVKKLQYCTINAPRASTGQLPSSTMQFSQTRLLDIPPRGKFVDKVPMDQIAAPQYNLPWKDPEVYDVKLIIRILRIEWEDGSEQTFSFLIPT